MKIGLVGEAPNDTRAIQNLLQRNYQNFDFIELLSRIDGSMLDNKKAIKTVRREFELQRPDIVIFIRDLDSLEKDMNKLRDRKETFIRLNKIIDKKGIFLLNIYEIEALILADIDTFNKEYSSSVERFSDPMKVSEPKEVLIIATRKTKKQFNVSHNPKVFGILNFNTVKQNCRYFKTFVEKFDKALA